MAAFNVLICGAGIAGIEGLLRLRRLAGDGVRLTLLSPEQEFVYRPLAVLEPFASVSTRRYPVARIASDTSATWVRDSLLELDMDARAVHSKGGRVLGYDALLLAVGGGESSPYEHAVLFTDRDGGAGFRAIVRDIEAGHVTSVAFVLANWAVWPLPLYELALMTADRARAVGVDLQLTFVTPEGRPLKAFGQAAGDAITELFTQAGIELHTGAVAQVPDAHVVAFADKRVQAQRIVTLPKVTGPALAGVPAGPGWFIPIDDQCLVPSSDGRVFAAGDATDFAVKHGGIGAQQADTAAAGIAHLAGLGERPPAIKPEIRSTLLTGERPLYLSARVVDGLGWRSQVYEQPPWPAEQKVIAQELGPYLETLHQRFAADAPTALVSRPVTSSAGR
jgi:sulfide:quinone oxidoreductase